MSKGDMVTKVNVEMSLVNFYLVEMNDGFELF